MLIFNKQYREEAKLFAELARKVKNSKDIKLKLGQNDSTYKLNTIDITFYSIKNLLKVQDKDGNIIVDLDCKFAGTPSNIDMELSNARFSMFCNLLDLTRKTYGKLKQKEKMEEATRKTNAKIAETKKSKQENELREAAIIRAREQLKGL